MTDPEVAEEYAEGLPIDPAPDDVNHYLRMVGDPAAVPTGTEDEPLVADPVSDPPPRTTAD